MISTSEAFLSSAAVAAAMAMRCASSEGPSWRAFGGGADVRAGRFSAAFARFFTAMSSSTPDLPLAHDDPLLGGQAVEPHGTVGVELRGRNPDLRAQAELAAVVEACRSVDEHAAGVDLAQPALSVLVIFRANGVGVIRAVARHVL